MPQQTSGMSHKRNAAEAPPMLGDSTGVAGTPRSGLRPPLIIAKIIVEAINKKKEVSSGAVLSVPRDDVTRCRQGNAENYRNVIEHLNTPNMKVKSPDRSCKMGLRWMCVCVCVCVCMCVCVCVTW